MGFLLFCIAYLGKMAFKLSFFIGMSEITDYLIMIYKVIWCRQQYLDWIERKLHIHSTSLHSLYLDSSKFMNQSFALQGKKQYQTTMFPNSSSIKKHDKSHFIFHNMSSLMKFTASLLENSRDFYSYCGSFAKNVSSALNFKFTLNFQHIVMKHTM